MPSSPPESATAYRHLVLDLPMCRVVYANKYYNITTALLKSCKSGKSRKKYEKLFWVVFQLNCTALLFQDDPASCDLRDVVVGQASTNPMGCLILKSCDIITTVPTNEKCSYNCSCDSNPCHADIVIGPSTVSDNIRVCKIEYIDQP